VNLSGETVRHPSAKGVVLPPRSVWWNPAFDKTASERVQPLTRGAVRALRIARVWRARIGTTGRGCSRRRARLAREGRAVGLPGGEPRAARARRSLRRRSSPWVKGRAFHGFRKFSAGEIHRLTGSERAAADWIGDKDVKVVRKHYLKKRAEEQRGVAQQVDVDVLLRDECLARLGRVSHTFAPSQFGRVLGDMHRAGILTVSEGFASLVEQP
jgi:hypothetical protein